MAWGGMNYAQRKYEQRRVRRLRRIAREKRALAAQKICKKCGGKVFIGVEIRGVYDGVLFWVCEQCKHAQPRDWGSWEAMQQKSDEYAGGHNILLEERKTNGPAGSETEPSNRRGEPLTDPNTR